MPPFSSVEIARIIARFDFSDMVLASLLSRLHPNKRRDSRKDIAPLGKKINSRKVCKPRPPYKKVV
jgi:hypothetical protein